MKRGGTTTGAEGLKRGGTTTAGARVHCGPWPCCWAAIATDGPQRVPSTEQKPGNLCLQPKWLPWLPATYADVTMAACYIAACYMAATHHGCLLHMPLHTWLPATVTPWLSQSAVTAGCMLQQQQQQQQQNLYACIVCLCDTCELEAFNFDGGTNKWCANIIRNMHHPYTYVVTQYLCLYDR
jgi:hypothetical protein